MGLLIAFTAAAAVLVAGAGAATAAGSGVTSCDQVYGCQPSPPPTSSPTCSLSQNSGTPGTAIVGIRRGARVGTAVTLTFDGPSVVKPTVAADTPGATDGS